MLKTDYKDDVLNTDINVNRKFSIVRSNGTVVEQNVELRETTAFKQVGDSFGAKDINETNEAIVDVRGQICTNLLNPTTLTQTVAGVTFTNNGDGTYTVNGTPTGDYALISIATADVKSGYKLVGCPQGGGKSSFALFKDSAGQSEQIIDYGNGNIIDINESNANIYIIVYKGYKANNLLFKPMLTTDINATYDDFVPYTGDSGRLNEDVADVTSKFQNLQVGGRNLIVNSKDEVSAEYPTSGNINLSARIDFALPTGATHFVLSFDAKSTVTGDKISSYFYDVSYKTTKSENSVGEISTAVDGEIHTELTNDWKRYWVKWTASIADNRTVIIARLTAGEGSGTVSIRNIKLEIGTVPTDWTPAPEDLETTPITNSDIDTILNS